MREHVWGTRLHVEYIPRIFFISVMAPAFKLQAVPSDRICTLWNRDVFFFRVCGDGYWDEKLRIRGTTTQDLRRLK